MTEEKAKDTGGPAFPTEPNTQSGFYSHHGMSLRDYFAGQVLAGLMASAEEHFHGDGKSEAAVSAWHQQVEGNWAKFSYRMADAMLAAREAS